MIVDQHALSVLVSVSTWEPKYILQYLMIISAVHTQTKKNQT